MQKAVESRSSSGSRSSMSELEDCREVLNLHEKPEGERVVDSGK